MTARIINNERQVRNVNKYDIDKEFVVYLIIMGVLFVFLLIMCLTTDKKSEEMVAHAPDMAYTYEPMEEELSEMQNRIIEEQKLLEKEECLW